VTQIAPKKQTIFVEKSFLNPSPEKIRELARRGEARGTSEAPQMLVHGIETGRGGCYLRLTPEQYKKLRQIKTVG
jgi:hypothetical protein